ncbi:hypothetical protein JCM10213v2_002739 [Rhodosporidiobolus nylandii]
MAAQPPAARTYGHNPALSLSNRTPFHRYKRSSAARRRRRGESARSGPGLFDEDGQKGLVEPLRRSIGTSWAYSDAWWLLGPSSQRRQDLWLGNSRGLARRLKALLAEANLAKEDRMEILAQVTDLNHSPVEAHIGVLATLALVPELDGMRNELETAASVRRKILACENIEEELHKATGKKERWGSSRHAFGIDRASSYHSLWTARTTTGTKLNYHRRIHWLLSLAAGKLATQVNSGSTFPETAVKEALDKLVMQCLQNGYLKVSLFFPFLCRALLSLIPVSPAESAQAVSSQARPSPWRVHYSNAVKPPSFAAWFGLLAAAAAFPLPFIASFRQKLLAMSLKQVVPFAVGVGLGVWASMSRAVEGSKYRRPR